MPHRITPIHGRHAKIITHAPISEFLTGFGLVEPPTGPSILSGTPAHTPPTVYGIWTQVITQRMTEEMQDFSRQHLFHNLLVNMFNQTCLH